MRSPSRLLPALLLLIAAPSNAAPVPAATLSARLLRFDGSAAAPAASPAVVRQMLFELAHAGRVPGVPDTGVLRDAAQRATRAAANRIPLAVVDVAAERGRTFAFAPLRARSYRGADVAFALDAPQWVSDGDVVRALAFDAGDGAGFRPLGLDQVVHARYVTVGSHTLTLRATRADGSALEAHATFEVAALATPSPTDTIHVTASIPYQGVAGTGNGYVDLAPGHTQLVNPVLVIEGFDIDNSMGWDELYALLDQQNLLENLRGMGYDPVVLDFTDATDDMHRNAFVFTTLLQQVEDAIAPSQTVLVAGASMGAVIGRYGLAYLESHGMPHRVRTFLSFDGPHQGADIPIGIQYWVQFFAGQSSDAATLVADLNRPAARQLLVYHTPLSGTGVPVPDPLRAAWQADLAAVGGMPHQCRNVAIANGSGAGVNQGFAPLDQLIRYEYNVLVVQVRGDVWALPSGVSGKVFDGKIYEFPSTSTTETVTVNGARPYDGAPGGWRNTMAEMDSVAVPVGDIVALHPNHCFVPTISSLDLATPDLFHNCFTDPNVASLSPFDTLYVPQQNQEHVSVTAENAAWITAEVTRGMGSTAVPFASAPAGLALGRPAPEPFRSSVRIPFTLGARAPVRLTLLDLAGREVARLVDGELSAGAHEARWDGRAADGRVAPAGVYFARLAAGRITRTTRLVLAR